MVHSSFYNQFNKLWRGGRVKVLSTGWCNIRAVNAWSEFNAEFKLIQFKNSYVSLKKVWFVTPQQIQWLVNCAAKHVALIRPSIHTGWVEQRAIKSQWWGKAPARNIQAGWPLWTATQFCLRLSILPGSLFTRVGCLSALGQVDGRVRILLCILRPSTWLM